MFSKIKTPFRDCFIVEAPIFEDTRGSFKKIFNIEESLGLGIKFPVHEVYYTQSQKNVIRGMHFQTPPYEHYKMVHCITGSAVDVLVDLRKSEPTFQQVFCVSLDQNNNRSVVIPPGIAHGFKAVLNETILLYRVSTVYKKECDQGILFSSIDFDWGIENPIVSERDTSFPRLGEFESPF